MITEEGMPEEGMPEEGMPEEGMPEEGGLPEPGPDAARVKRLRIRAWRRGFRELDLILGSFADRHGAELDAADLAQFETFLDLPDQAFYGWLIGIEPAPETIGGPFFTRLSAFARMLSGPHGGA